MTRINWPKLWYDFGKWCDDPKQVQHGGYPVWWKDQQPKIQAMVEEALKPKKPKKPKKRG